MQNPSRRQALVQLAAIPTLPSIASWDFAFAAADLSASHIATNTYPWMTFARREKREFKIHSDQLLSSIAETGINGYEPIIESPQEFQGLQSLLKKHHLQMQSIYVNSVLHDFRQADQSIEQVLAIAAEAQKLGVKIIVTSPSPIRWGGTEDKSDTQLRFQATALDRLGEKVRRIGLTLAYHNHDAELRQGGREFHHMLTATDPENVKFCLDAHWIYRGCGNSEVAVLDALSHYHERIVELHLRQSRRGVWTEIFSMQGDINYTRLFAFLQNRELRPHFVLEQAVEDESKQDLRVVEAHRNSYQNLKKAIT